MADHPRILLVGRDAFDDSAADDHTVGHLRHPRRILRSYHVESDSDGRSGNFPQY
jgi:hypothetical protein